MWLQLILQYGIPVAYKIWQEWRNKSEPTQADWDALLALSQKTTAEYVAEARAAASVSTPPQ